MVEWTVTWKQNGTRKGVSTFSKKAAVHQYLDVLDGKDKRDVSELKIFKNEQEYTGTLNRFLMK